MTSNNLKRVGGLVIWVLVCFAAAAIGAIASLEANEFYARLSQPTWAPPASVFGPVWTILYAMMAVSAWMVWLCGGFKRHARAFGFFFSQLIMNALWSWMFFAWHQGALAMVNILILWLLIVATIIGFYQVKPLAGYFLVPYLLWVSFATFLNYSVWQLNPQLL